MKILFAGYTDSALIDWLIKQGEDVIFTSDKVDLEFLKRNKIEFIISYGYRHIIKEEIIKEYFNKIINLHISYLPYGRGADPNLWSILEETTTGVTIHYIDKGIDTGDILLQKEVLFNENDTLKTSYNKLKFAIEILFIQNWQKIKHNNIEPKKQIGEGTYHKSKEKETISYLLKDGWNTKINYIKNFRY
jgi:methionyl-tRNA formyltransferase